jgi:hypothetical protein
VSCDISSSSRHHQHCTNCAAAQLHSQHNLDSNLCAVVLMCCICSKQTRRHISGLCTCAVLTMKTSATSSQRYALLQESSSHLLSCMHTAPDTHHIDSVATPLLVPAAPLCLVPERQVLQCDAPLLLLTPPVLLLLLERPLIPMPQLLLLPLLWPLLCLLLLMLRFPGRLQAAPQLLTPSKACGRAVLRAHRDGLGRV